MSCNMSYVVHTLCLIGSTSVQRPESISSAVQLGFKRSIVKPRAANVESWWLFHFEAYIVATEMKPVTIERAAFELLKSHGGTGGNLQEHSHQLSKPAFGFTELPAVLAAFPPATKLCLGAAEVETTQTFLESSGLEHDC